MNAFVFQPDRFLRIKRPPLLEKLIFKPFVAGLPAHIAKGGTAVHGQPFQIDDLRAEP